MAWWEPNQCRPPGGVDFPAFILMATLLMVGGDCGKGLAAPWHYGWRPGGVMAALCLSLLIDLDSIISVVQMSLLAQRGEAICPRSHSKKATCRTGSV